MSDQDRKATADSEKDEKLEDLEAGEDEAAHIKRGGPKDQTIQTGGGPEN